MTNPNVPPMPQMPPMPQPHGGQNSVPQPQYAQPGAAQVPPVPQMPQPQAQPQAQQYAAPQYQQPTYQWPAQQAAVVPQAAPQQYAQQPVQPTAVYSARPARQLRTKRGLLKYILLGLVTLGIYDIWQMSEVGESLNLIASRRDGKKTMHYCLLFFLVGPVTLGIAYFFWFHRMCTRVGEEQAARGMTPTVSAATYWLWGVLGAFIIVGPFIFYYKLLHAMNDLSADYNVRG
ncbi:DUF4234 domain-containing protein [Bifidobacterium olomucense]|uniref:DUF4234 domain-containing protein n=1 Tax=Bifidobacterium olomucense TaxID=2675324 RepID=A0A7Y0F000_9BIFI|nr:DUF4234 domain-containing protein [Bifidobacterium sp. DSM 109959]NMM98561.1 hypothetical protein [Bifidobacterium sp. DSM 109959]